MGRFRILGRQTTGDNYPPSVVAAGLQNVWNLQSIAGNRVDPASLTSFAAFSAALPTGVTKKVPPATTEANAAIIVAATVSINSTSLVNSGIYIRNDGVVATFTDCTFGNDGGNRMFVAGMTDGGVSAGSPTVNFNYCTFDLTGIGTGAAGAMAGLNSSVINLSHCSFSHAPRLYANTGGSGSPHDLTVSNCVFRGFGENGLPADHLEALHHSGGSAAYSESLFYPELGLEIPADAGITANLFFHAFGSALSDTVDSCIIMAKVNQGGPQYLPYPMQLKATDGYDCLVTISNCVIEEGSSGYITGVNYGRLTMTSYTGTFSNGETIQTGSEQALVVNWNSTTKILIISPKAGAGKPWAATFTPGVTVTGLTSGATGLVATTVLNVTTLTDGGGNLDYATGSPITLTL